MLGARRIMSIIPAAEIPTLTLLYKLNKLHDARLDGDAELPKPSQSFNDRIGLIRGDITKVKVDAIVNAANNSLRGGGGVDGAIHAAAGDGLLSECRKLGRCDTGSAKITGAYELPCKKVIHAVGPVYYAGEKKESAELLEGCYNTSLQLAVDNKCKSIVFSALSTGIYGYPSFEAAPVAIKTVKDFLEGPDGDKLEKVVFCTFVQKDVDAYNTWLPRYFPRVVAQKEESDWEQVEAEGSAENGIPKSNEDSSIAESVKEEWKKVVETDDKASQEQEAATDSTGGEFATKK